MVAGTMQKLRPFPYQQEALDAIAAGRERGIDRQLVVMATGAGKTVVFSHLVDQMDWRTVIVVHRDELVRQTIDKLSTINPLMQIGVVKAERNQADSRVVVASAATLVQDRRLEAVRAATAGPLLLISDEAHHDRADGRQKIIDRLAPDLLVGFTATPERGDGLALGGVYQEIVYSIGMMDLIRLRQLSQLTGIRVGTDVLLDDVHTVAGEFNERELEAAVDTPERNRLIVAAWQRHAAGRRRTVIFCVNIAHAEHVAQAFTEAGITNACIFGETPKDERERIYAAFHDGAIPVLINVMVLTEGYDEPGIDCIIMARPTKSRGLYIQCVGRGARKSDLKENCLILDVVDVTKRHRLITLPHLATDDGDIQDTRKDDEPVNLLEFSERRVSDAKAALRHQSEQAALFDGSLFIWRNTDNLRYAAAGKSTWIVLRQTEGAMWMPLLLEGAREGTPAVRPLFSRPLDFGYAMGVAEAEGERYALRDPFVRKGGWREQVAPPTEAQRAIARKLKVKLSPDETKASISLKIDEAIFMNNVRRATW